MLRFRIATMPYPYLRPSSTTDQTLIPFIPLVPWSLPWNILITDVVESFKHHSQWPVYPGENILCDLYAEHKFDFSHFHGWVGEHPRLRCWIESVCSRFGKVSILCLTGVFSWNIPIQPNVTQYRSPVHAGESLKNQGGTIQQYYILHKYDPSLCI